MRAALVVCVLFVLIVFSFRLHYQYTFGILAIACLLVTSYGYIDSAGQAQTDQLLSFPQRKIL